MTTSPARAASIPPRVLAPLLIAAVTVQQGPAALELFSAGSWRAIPAAEPGAPAITVPTLGAAITWRSQQPGFRVGDFEVRTAEGLLRNSVAVVEIDPTRFRFELAAQPGWRRRTADEWLRADTGIVLAANTGLFRSDGTPQGLVLIGGARRSPAAAWLDAVVALEDGTPRLVDVEGAHALGGAVSAFQTLPWLVQGGRVALGATSGTRLSRTHRDRRFTLCLAPDGLVRLFLSNFEVFGAPLGRIPVGLTLPEQAALAAGAGCRDAVALDGGISAQMALRTEGRVVLMPGWRRVPLLLVLRRR